MKAFEIIEKPENWTQGENARDEGGNGVSSIAPEATCFCLNGAIVRAYGDGYAAKAPYKRVQKALGGSMVSKWNDAPERTHAEVYNLLKSLDI